MRQEIVHYLSNEEEELVRILISFGFNRRVALVLVFLSKSGKVTIRDISRGTDLGLSEISHAIRFLSDRQWIEVCDNAHTRGGSYRIYALTMPFSEIMNSIADEEKVRLKNQFAFIQKMKKDFV
jgi:predicted transcriptional regulator